MNTITRPTDETNGLDLIGYDYHERVAYAEEMTLREVADAHGKITRVRVLGGGAADGFRCDVSYIHATVSGKIVPVTLGDLSSNFLRGLKGDLIEWAKSQGVFAKSLGLLDENNWSVLK